MMRKFSLLMAALLVVGCGGSGNKAESTNESARATAETPPPPPAEVAQAGPVELATRSVKCGCAIDGIGACGDYVEIDGRFVKLANYAELGLGSMEWCGQDGVTAETAGEIKDGQFIASTLTVTQTE
jgi:hypothetical protein